MFKSFLSLWLKFPCVLCQRIAEDVICHYCQKKLASYRINQPQKDWCDSLPIFAWGKYDGELSRAIAKMKYDNHPEIGVILGKWLGQSWIQNCPIDSQLRPIILPVPLHDRKLKKRGFNQAESIAKGFCQITKYSLVTRELKRIKDTKAMFGLNAVQRKINLKNAFKLSNNWRQNPPLSPILLLDDIYTRGTTIKEITKVLSQKKIAVLGTVTVSITIKY